MLLNNISKNIYKKIKINHNFYVNNRNKYSRFYSITDKPKSFIDYLKSNNIEKGFIRYDCHSKQFILSDKCLLPLKKFLENDKIDFYDVIKFINI